MMKEFMDEYGFDIAHLRVILDQNPENPHSVNLVYAKYFNSRILGDTRKVH